MREFSDFEQDILSKMIDLQNEKKLCRYYLLCEVEKELEIEKKGSSDIQIVSDSINKDEILNILIQFSFLFRYLKENFYLLDFERNIDSKVDLKEESQKKHKLKTETIYPKEYFIFKYNCFYNLSLSETIVDLVKNNFKTVEQIRFEKQLVEAKKQTKYSRRAFYVSIAALIVSLISGIITQCSHGNVKL